MTSRRRYSLRLVLAVSLIGLQLVAVSAIVFFTFLSSERALLRQSHALLTEASENVISQIRAFLAPARQSLDVTRRLAENHVLEFADDQTLEIHLFQQLLTAPQLAGFYFAQPDGRFVYVMRTETQGRYRTKIIDAFEMSRQTHPARFIWRNDQFEALETAQDQGDTYEARTRPWFTAVQASLNEVWTEPYIYFTTRQPGITYAAPVMADDGTLLGILGIDIEIDDLSGFLSDLWADKGGAAIIMNQNGEVLAHPELVLIRNDADMDHPSLTTVDQIADPVAQAAFSGLPRQEIDTTEGSVAELSLGGKRYVSLFVAVPEPNLNWSVGIYAPVDAFIGEIQSDRVRWVWVAALVVSLTGLISIRLADRINRPLRNFVSETKLAMSGGAGLIDTLRSPYKELEGAGEVLKQEIRQRQRFENAFGRTFELTSRGMAQIEPETGRFLRVNSQLGTLLGVPAEQLMTKTLLDFVPSEGKILLTIFNKTLRENSEFIDDVRFTLMDGRKTWLRMNAILILDELGLPDHAITIFDDINAQKQNAELTLQLSRDLSHRARVNLMGEMASGMAHELNQPLSAIVHNIDTLQFALREIDLEDEEIVQICGDIERQAHRAGDIIRALRDFVRKDRGRMTSFNIVDLCAQSITLIDVEARTHNIQIVLEHDDPSDAIGNRTQVAQVIVNLLRNAVDAVAASASAVGRVELVIVSKRDEILVCIEDYGKGVAEEASLFQNFSTLKPGGMGLGLSISRSIVEAHGGKIWYERPDHDGARFCFTLRSDPEARGGNK